MALQSVRVMVTPLGSAMASLSATLRAMSWAKHWQQRIGVTLARGRAAVLLAALRRGDSETVMIDENVARREVETMEWSADVGAGSQATAAAEMQRWA